ncbi:oligopeptide/dipeptide ABC transporter, ATPase subunit [Alkaliphilus metalliredigens QYMF]|uniref:Oligopeptide/dipeptide ABC transporter, ATPase subunit n=1 Tax=Alkaliphilus metalliredigens (strain QYMF) TaxID=293826 RepID=A6TNE1_ALKMQ|nr:ABC transporter ATP-binding protein [Alkaliphilus metalliredigens]ABR47709.1 oligopeptide/dipeptide ABC transporter, ATPase subunit [Alkaliphilus metalliredigens QYMF]
MKVKKTLLEVKNLVVDYPYGNDKITAVKDISFTIEEGNILGIIGESGSGKTSIALALMRLHDKGVRTEGEIFYDNQPLHQLSEKGLNKHRWKDIAIVYQNHLDILNPVMTVKEQILEAIKKHLNLCEKDRDQKIKELLKMVNLEEQWGHAYPHQLSGGMRQKILIAMALACDPSILIVDEPTTALDAIGKEEILDLLERLQKNKKFAMLLISHDMYVIQRLSNKLAVMYQGRILEEGLTKDVLENPRHVYTRGLLDASLDINPYQDLWGIPEGNPIEKEDACIFYGRCYQKKESCKEKLPQLQYVSLERKVACNRGGIITLLEGKGISKIYEGPKNQIKACENCNIKVPSGEVVALMGQSGSGKTTLGTILSGLLKGNGGEVTFDGKLVTGNNFTSIKQGIQIIFQDPFSATNGNFTVEEIVREPLDILRIDTKEEKNRMVVKALEEVQLPITKDFLQRKCKSLSGGQRQRLAIARGLVMEPKLLIADEISSMLDPSTKANVLRLLKGLQNKFGFAMLYITHDLALARKISNKVCIMYKGEIIEQGSANQVFEKPQSDYGKKLLRGWSS